MTGSQGLHIYFIYLLSFLLGLHPWNMEVPRLGVKLWSAYTTATAMPDPSVSAAYITAHSNTGSLTH